MKNNYRVLIVLFLLYRHCQGAGKKRYASFFFSADQLQQQLINGTGWVKVSPYSNRSSGKAYRVFTEINGCSRRKIAGITNGSGACSAYQEFVNPETRYYAGCV